MDFTEVFSQNNEQQRDNLRRRDQVIYFYIAIVGAYFAIAKDSLESTSFANLANPFLLTLALLGLIIGAIVVQYRKWHIRYVNSAKVITFFAKNTNPIDNEGLSIGLEKLIRSIYEYLGISAAQKESFGNFGIRYFSGVEFLTYQAFLIVAALPAYLVVIESLGISPNHHWALIFLIFLLLYLLFMNFSAMSYLFIDIQKNSPFALWIIPDNEKNMITAIIEKIKNEIN